MKHTTSTKIVNQFKDFTEFSQFIKISPVSVTAYRAFQLPSYLNREVIKPPATTRITPVNDAATVMLPITWLKNIIE